jgi:small subunit ribosomal protein S18
MIQGSQFIPSSTFGRIDMAIAKKRAKTANRSKKKDPVFVDGKRPRPMYVDYKDLELLSKMISRQGKLIGRRKTGCTAVSQHAVSQAVKRARFMALLPYVGD